MRSSGRNHLSLLGDNGVVAVLIALHALPSAEGYKHVVFMHGLFSGAVEFTHFNDLIQNYHPGTPTTLVNSFASMDSLTRLTKQVETIAALLAPVLTNKSSDGTILICYSQGGLICRGLLALVQHNVDTFISLSSPLAGQYGDTEYLKVLFPKYVKKHMYKLFYTSIGQQLSIANYWNDPHQQALYEKFSDFLAILNNQSRTASANSHEYRNNFLRLKNLVLVGGPDDEVISPWQSSQFGMYNTTERVLPMEQQKWYQNDAFGLKNLNERGAVHMHVFPGIRHNSWPHDENVFTTCIKPWLT
ncbi:unnamed protein product [Candidula unifasciata]|uniref:palmitoyl-CoA hydrolase n=1 Tax=Candidula unifasciata TaxID=100452 RepID=A0A8S4A1A7_9EUPU|nr:unnamed protein product [Candidula unifasciata]